MSLSRAIELLTPDRETEAALRDILQLFASHPRDWLADSRIENATAVRPELAERILTSLRRGYVLDFDDDPPRYRYSPDTLLDVQVSGILRRADGRADNARANLERFRSRYGSR